MRKARPHTAEVTLRFRVPKGFSAAQARALIKNNVPMDFYTDYHEEEAIGTGEVKMRVGSAKIIRAKA